MCSHAESSAVAASSPCREVEAIKKQMVKTNFLRPGDGIRSKTRPQMLAFVKEHRLRIKKKFDWSVSQQEWLRVLRKRNALSVAPRARRGQAPPPAAPPAAAAQDPQASTSGSTAGRQTGSDANLFDNALTRREPSLEIVPVAGPSSRPSNTWTTRWFIGPDGKGFGNDAERRRIAQVLEKAGVKEEHQVNHLAENEVARKCLLRGLKDELTLYEISAVEAMLENRRN